jgi:hypothetical protein
MTKAVSEAQLKRDVKDYVQKLAHDSGHPTAEALYESLLKEGCSEFAITEAAHYLRGEYTTKDGGRKGCQFCNEEWHVPTVDEAKARKFVALDEDCNLLIETKKWPKAKKTPSQDYSWWGTPEEQELWLTPGSQHYMNATSNSNRNYQLTRSFRDSYVQTRGYEVYDTDKLKQELAAYIETLDEGAKITSVIEPPEAIKALHSLPSPGHWFQCPIDKKYIDTTAFAGDPHPEDHYIQAFHATGITSALHIVYQGHVNAGLGQSA